MYVHGTSKHEKDPSENSRGKRGYTFPHFKYMKIYCDAQAPCIIDSNTCYQVNRYKTPSGDVEGKKILYFDVKARFYALRKMFV